MEWLWIALVTVLCVGAVWWMLRSPGGGDDDGDTPLRFGGGGKR